MLVPRASKDENLSSVVVSDVSTDSRLILMLVVSFTQRELDSRRSTRRVSCLLNLDSGFRRQIIKTRERREGRHFDLGFDLCESMVDLSAVREWYC